MIHPLLRLVATQPQLLADHAEAYAGLVADELGKTGAVWKQRVLMAVIAISLIGVAAVLGGVALMLWAVLPATSIQAPWALFAAPAVPAIAALACVLVAKQEQAGAFAELKQQVAADLVMLREVSAA